MLTGRRVSTRFAALGVCLGLATASRDSRAEDVRECLAASDEAQLLRDERKFLRSRERLLECVRKCPEVVSKDCTSWLADVDARTPTIIVAVKDHRGRDSVDGEVFIDGVKLTSQLEGHEQPLDPGRHTLRVRASGGVVEETVVLREREKGRFIRLTVGGECPEGQRPDAARGGTCACPAGSVVDANTHACVRVPPPVRTIPILSYALGGVAVLGAGAFGYFFLSASSDRRDLDRSCAPACDSAKVDDIRERNLIADLSLGVAGLALAGAVVVYFMQPRAKTATSQLFQTAVRF